jgi:NADH-quinone oxidoreductase subunit A
MQYFRIALIFLIFDLEILFLFPWISVSKFFIVNGYLYILYSIIPFIFFLILGIFYEFILNLINWQFKI